jgi:hypothetical protein
MNVKQQLLLKKDELIQQAETEVATWPSLPQNNNNIKINSNTSQVITTNLKPTTNSTKPLVNGHAAAEQIKTDGDIVNNNSHSLSINKIPAPLTNINVITPSIMPLLTPPTPPPHSTTQTDENQNNNSLPNGSLVNSISSVKQTSKLLNDTSNVKIESAEQQSASLGENNKKYEKKT